MDHSLQQAIKTPTIHVWALIALTVLAQASKGYYSAKALPTPDVYAFLSFIALYCLVGNWLARDSKASNVQWARDMGFFHQILWPIFIPIYLIDDKGWKFTLITVSASLALYFGTYYLSYLAFING